MPLKKTEEVRKLNLPHVAADFCVHVETETCFAVEKQLLLGVGLAKTKIVIAPVDSAEVAGWTGDHPDQVKILREKVKLMPTLNGNAAQEFQDRVIKHYLEGQNALAQLNEKYPEQYEQVRLAKDQREQFLETECLISGSTPGDLLMTTLQKFKEHLTTDIVGISEYTADRLTWEAISDWLIRCPLKFAEHHG
jgi:hypothetical protein